MDTVLSNTSPLSSFSPVVHALAATRTALLINRGSSCALSKHGPLPLPPNRLRGSTTPTPPPIGRKGGEEAEREVEDGDDEEDSPPLPSVPKTAVEEEKCAGCHLE
jgi:hypothetical protein